MNLSIKMFYLIVNRYFKTIFQKKKKTVILYGLIIYTQVSLGAQNQKLILFLTK